MFRKLLLLGAAPLALAGCAAGLTDAAPVTAGQAAPISAQERQLGAKANADILTEFGGAYTGPGSAYIAQVGRRIAAESGLAASPSAFNVTVLNSPVNNAFAIPGGYIYITRNLVALMNDEAELAAVLGHEVAHVAARHSQGRQSAATRNSVLGTLGQLLVSAVTGNSALGQVLSQGIGTGAQLLTLGYSRSQETQADDLGIQYLARAGYDPAALSSALASLAAQNALDARIRGTDARTVPEWASTHPDPASRVQRARGIAASTATPAGQRRRDAFLAAIDGMLYGEDPEQGVIEGRTFLHPVLRIAFTVPAGFTMQNGAQAVTITGPNAQARFSSGSHGGSLEAYINRVLQGLAGSGAALPQGAVQRTSVNGIPAAFVQVRASSGSTPVDVTVFAYAPPGGTAYHFVAVTPAGQGLGAMTGMVQSFRQLSTAEAAAIKPRYLRIVTVRAGDTPASIAGRMAYDDYKLERFLVLNGLAQGATLRPGDRVKIVSY